jgi:serine/threonine protein kinase
MASDPASGPDDSDSRVRSLFTQYIASRETGQPIEFDAFCAEHPGDASALRKVREEWEWVRSALQSAVGQIEGDLLAARPNAKPGDELESSGLLDSPADADLSADSASTDALVKRLAELSLARSRYKLEAEVARGGMGAIFRVWDEQLRRHLAMKVILGKGETLRSGSSPHVDPVHLARFLEEARVTGRLDHPGIVPVHELGLDSEGRVYFTMKLVKGRDLRKIFDLVFEQKEGWNETRALAVILKACEALAYAHDKGVIHRDLKPSNVMVGNFGEVFVMDWGLARVLGKEDRHDIRIQPDSTAALAPTSSGTLDEGEAEIDSPIVTMDGDVIGTPAYMPPEQARGEIEKLGPRADVYGVGAMLYHLLARQMPYAPADARMTNREILDAVLAGPPRPLHDINKEVPAELVAICEKAMARDAERRYANTSALGEDLRAFLEHRVVGAYEAGTWAETRKWVQRNTPLAASLAGAVFLLVVGLATSLVFKSRADENAVLAEQRATETAAQASIAEANATRAMQQERIATQKANDVLSLSAIQELKELTDEAGRLWPAHPENLPKYEAWLAKARLLVEGSATEEGPGKPAHPSLADHEAKLAEIRKRAKPISGEQVETDRMQSASFAAWQKERARLQWMRRMLGLEPWPSENDVEADLAKASLPLEANGLNEMAWPLVDTDSARIVYGGEVRGLALARRAVAIANDIDRPMFRDTVAWANFRTGRFDEARAEEEQAGAEVDEARKPEIAEYVAKLEQAIAEWSGDQARSRRSQEASELAVRVAALERDVNARRTYKFDDAQERWWHAQLAQLVSDLKSFTDDTTGGLYSSGTSE